MDEVYTATTAPNPKSSWFQVPSQYLDRVRFGVKVCEVLLSSMAFILEEVVVSCVSCSALYFFEFISCTAFLFTLLLLLLLCTPLHSRVGISSWPRVDFIYTGVIALLFLIASSAFAANNSSTTLEKSAVVFGFFATLAFVLDLGWFWKTGGFPFKSSRKPEESNGIPPSVEVQAETEKLAPPPGEQ